MNVNQRRTVFAYWHLFVRILTEKNMLDTLQWTLEESTHYAQSSAGWSGVLLFNAWAVHELIRDVKAFGSLGPDWLDVVLRTLVWLMLSLVAGMAAYGIHRLFTLVSHVMVTTLFQVRGQRLRLLSLHTATLPLTFPIAVALTLLPGQPILGWAILSLTTAFGWIQLARGYNVIYHQQRLRGFWLVLGGVLVTVFVLSIGTIAVTVAFGVAAFIVAAVVRPLHHR